MAAKRVSATAIDWAKFAQNVPASDTAMYTALQSKNAQYRMNVNTKPTELPKIDFAHYLAAVPSLKKTIDDFSAKYSQVKIDYPVAPAELQAIDAQEKEHKAATTAWLSASKDRVAVAKAGLAQWETIPPLCQMTMQEWSLYFPGFMPDTKIHSYFQATNAVWSLNCPLYYYHYGNYRYIGDSGGDHDRDTGNTYGDYEDRDELGRGAKEESWARSTEGVEGSWLVKNK
jgi:hypothetical protein